MSEPSKKPDPLTRLWHACLLLLGCSVALWLAVQLIAQIWIWLIAAAVLAAAGTWLVLWLRRRGDRW